jgi:hypothetical protein
MGITITKMVTHPVLHNNTYRSRKGEGGRGISHGTKEDEFLAHLFITPPP